jgi:methanogenic corrinoid protein MtbC1
VELGHAIGQVAKLPESELDTLSSRNREAYSTIDETGDPYKQTISRFLEAVSRMDVVSADDEISRAATLYPPRVIVKNIVIPVLTEIGDRWAHRDFGIAQEHIATNLIRNLLSSLFRLYPPDASAETIVLATTSGERHEFGILTSALIAATRGWRVVYLGTELPAMEIVRTARIVKARVLAISVVNQNPQAYEEMKTIAENIPSQTRVWVGGAEALKHRDWFERVDWILVRDLEDLDDRLKR